MLPWVTFKNATYSLLIFWVLSACTKDQTGINETPLNPLADTTLVNVVYGTDPLQRYDIYLPAKRDTTTPLILMIHGGAWKAGQKEDLNPYLNLIKSKWDKVAIVNMNYRLASNALNIHHGEMINDIWAVVNHLKTNQMKYQISDKMGVMGASAGGQLAMIYAYRYNVQMRCVGNIFGPGIISDWSWYNSTNLWLGGYTGNILTEYVGKPWDTTAYKEVSPYWNINQYTPPTILFHGSLDPIVPVYQSQWMKSKLTSAGIPNEYHEYLAFHSFDNTQSDDVIQKMVTFFKLYLK